MNLDKDALICDLAETYNIYDYKSLPCTLVATFSCGLRDDSRIKRKISGINIDQSDLLLATLVDTTNLLLWIQTQDGVKGRNRPDSIVDSLLSAENTQKSDTVTFKSGKEFREEWNRRTKGE